MPPMALTIEVPNYKEGELLDYVWPVFSWNDWNNGFTNRTNNITPLNDNEVGFGYEACGLKAGYNRAKDGGMDSGPATWPVFCILDNERKLNGRFGDPQYSFLTFQLYRCGSPGVKLTKSLNETWQRDSKFSGKCATMDSGEKQKISNENIGEKIGMNVWFQFPTEDFSKGNSLIEKKEDAGQVGPWTWWIYEKLDQNTPSFLTIDLRHNTALINDPIWSMFHDGPFKMMRWFDWSGFEYTPSGTSSEMFENGSAPLVSASFRVSWMRREVSVVYTTYQEMLSEISGSWTGSLFIGFWFTVVFEALRKHKYGDDDEDHEIEDEESGEERKTV